MTQRTKRIILSTLDKPSKYFFGSTVTFLIKLYVNGNKIKSHFGGHRNRWWEEIIKGRGEPNQTSRTRYWHPEKKHYGVHIRRGS